MSEKQCDLNKYDMSVLHDKFGHLIILHRLDLTQKWAYADPKLQVGG